MSKKRGDRVEKMVYFDPDELPDLEAAMKKLKRDASGTMRWLVTEFAAGRLVEWHVVQMEQLMTLTKHLMHQVESLKAAQGDLPILNDPPANRETVPLKVTGIEGSPKATDKPASKPQHPK